MDYHSSFYSFFPGQSPHVSRKSYEKKDLTTSNQGPIIRRPIHHKGKNCNPAKFVELGDKADISSFLDPF
jgi:hypothetical protein